MPAMDRREFVRSAGLAAVGAALAPHVSGQVEADGVRFVGDGREVGRALGELCGSDIRAHMDQVLGAYRAKGLTDTEMIGLSDRLVAFAEKFAPFWLDEAHACAGVAGVDPDLYVAYLAGKYRSLFLVSECTSYLAVGDATADGATLFHKTRDNAPRSQSVYRKRIDHSSRPASFYAVGDTSDTGLMMMVNEHGVAGSADVGGIPEDRPKGRGVMNPYILRLVAERAENCDQALAILQECVRDGWYAGGSRVGTNWLLADRHGTGLHFAQNSHEERHEFIRDDTAFLVRGDTAGARCVTGRKGRVTVVDMNAAANDRSICFPTSISALTVRVDPDRPADLSSVWAALPAWAPYVPLFGATDCVPRALVGGSYSDAAYAIRMQDGEERPLTGDYVAARTELQAKIYRRAASLAERIRGTGDRAGAERLARSGAGEIARRALTFAQSSRER